jgi:2-polyprenyl-6-methoxyphenol hydroxylase-like FAD-dependent oxidoreductase
MITDIYDYPGPSRVDHGDHIYYDETVITSELVDAATALEPTGTGLDVAISGGSMGGLFTGYALSEAGHDVEIFERTEGEMEDRGAGIIAHPEMVDYLDREGIAESDRIAHSVDRIQYLDDDGDPLAEVAETILTSSWDTVYNRMRDVFPDDRYHQGDETASVTNEDGGATVAFTNGERTTGDVVVAAEGYRSSTRQQLLPDVEPAYAGYVAWRGVVHESELRPGLADRLMNNYVIYHGPDFQFLTYPVPGPNGEVTAGDRRANWVWYDNTPASDLETLLTDNEGNQRQYSLPPGKMREAVRDRQYEVATELLPDLLVELYEETPDPFIQNVYDVAVPRMVFDRICLLGDGAFFSRPHMASGTAKAVADGLQLAVSIDRTAGLDAALADWEESQLELGERLVERGRERGDRYMGRF